MATKKIVKRESKGQRDQRVDLAPTVEFVHKH